MRDVLARIALGQARRSSASGRAKDAFMKAMNDRRRSTTSPVATIGVLWATHCMHTRARVVRHPSRSGSARHRAIAND
jgi:hypothetical protein